ncbi:hypothetical protein RJ55_03214 [Drechmeria coniospora]|nr:hypothetical protein RJ55_03214 [Drechmeria coniospora]
MTSGIFPSVPSVPGKETGEAASTSTATLSNTSSATSATSATHVDLEPPHVRDTIKSLLLTPHIEGGYYALTDSSPTLIPSPYPLTSLSENTLQLVGGLRPDFDPAVRRASSSILYYLTPRSPVGSFHRNRSRIVHTLHRGRGCYVLIHPDRRVETFVVGCDIQCGEKLQWAVDGGVWKASYLLPNQDVTSRCLDVHDEELLISETVVPGIDQRHAINKVFSRI